jgi:branched-chain amino acid transport system permease protein
MQWLDALVQGILLGGFYALIAAGLSFMFGVMRIVNLSHGAATIVSAYCGLYLLEHTSMPWWLTLAIVVPVLAGLGFALQMFVLNPALQGNALTPILVTFGIAVVIANLLQQSFGADSQQLSAGAIAQKSIRLGEGLSVGLLPLITFAVGVLVIVALQLFLSHTAQGRAMRATSDDQVTAQLMGIDNRRVYALATAIAMATVGVAGIFLAVRTQFTPGYGDAVLLFAFEAVVIGGLGSIWGTLAGGVTLGVAQTLGSQWEPGYGVLIGHLVFLTILLVRPTGLFQKAVQA